MGRLIEHPLGGWFVYFCVFTTVGCSEGVTPSPPPAAVRGDAGQRSSAGLVEHTRWSLVSPSEDPYWVDDDGRIPCELQDIEFGADSVEVNTRYCNHATLMQPSLREVGGGEAVHEELWWQPLVSETSAVTRLRIRLGTTPLLEEDVPIPGPADVRHHRSKLESAIPANTPIYFHVSNHGINSYTLHLLDVEPQPTISSKEQ